MIYDIQWSKNPLNEGVLMQFYPQPQPPPFAQFNKFKLVSYNY